MCLMRKARSSCYDRVSDNNKDQNNCDGFNETSRNLEVLLKFQRTKEELT